MNLTKPVQDPERIRQTFFAKYNKNPEVLIQSPGRINIIGEHTDYNDGFVLPAAIDYHMYLALSRNDSNKISLYSIDYDESVDEDLSDIKPTDNAWLNLINGVTFQLKDRVTGFDLAFGGNIPVGAGVSSSAALCCGLAMGLSELYSLELAKWEMAKIAQRSEHDFTKVKCGIMDQFACLFGLINHVLLLDCKTNEYEKSEVNIEGFKFLLLNSNVKHSLGDSDYNQRREESQAALDQMKERFKSVDSYQDLTLEMLDEANGELDEVIWKRAHHVVSENARVHEMKDALKGKEYQKIGHLLTMGHESLKHNYQVTCEETDFLVDLLNTKSTVFGARQVGGGFGGCVLALVKDADTDLLVEDICKTYKKAYNLELDDIPIKISRGCHRVE